MKTKQIVLLLLRLTVAVIFLQTLYFKFTAHPDSVYIFTALGAEPYGRIGLGLLELFTAILILLPRTQLFGMLASLVIILGAVASHIVVIGIAIKNDGGGLFILALIVLIATTIFLYLQKNELIKTYQHYLP